MHFAKCEFKECDKKDTCERFLKAEACEINFKVICYNLGYKWYVPIETTDIVPVNNEGEGGDISESVSE